MLRTIEPDSLPRIPIPIDDHRYRIQELQRQDKQEVSARDRDFCMLELNCVQQHYRQRDQCCEPEWYEQRVLSKCE